MLALVILVLVQQQEVSPQEIEKAMQQDEAAKKTEKAQPPSSLPGEPPSTPNQTPPSYAAQLGVQRPGATLLNPAIAAIMHASYGYYGIKRSDFDAAGLPLAGDDPAREGFNIQEIEFAFQAAIDPYLEGILVLTIPNLDGIEVEEAYLVTTSLPFNLQIKAGGFRSQIGRNNTQHLELQFFARRPLLTALLLGDDGLRPPGLQVSVLLPLPWFATLYAEALSVGEPDDKTRVKTFGGASRNDPEDLTYTAVLEQYWDPSENTSLFLGLNFATGKSFECLTDACSPSRRDYLYGGDLYFKWRPPNVVRTYAMLSWTTEWFVRTIDGGPTEGALYTEPVLRFARQWHLGARFDLTGVPDGPNVPRRYGISGALTYFPSEFSLVRGYVQEIIGPNIPSSTVFFVQTEFSMGAHGAHPF